MNKIYSFVFLTSVTPHTQPTMSPSTVTITDEEFEQFKKAFITFQSFNGEWTKESFFDPSTRYIGFSLSAAAVIGSVKMLEILKQKPNHVAIASLPLPGPDCSDEQVMGVVNWIYDNMNHDSGNEYHIKTFIKTLTSSDRRCVHEFASKCPYVTSDEFGQFPYIEYWGLPFCKTLYEMKLLEKGHAELILQHHMTSSDEKLYLWLFETFYNDDIDVNLTKEVRFRMISNKWDVELFNLNCASGNIETVRFLLHRFASNERFDYRQSLELLKLSCMPIKVLNLLQQHFKFSPEYIMSDQHALLKQSLKFGKYAVGSWLVHHFYIPFRENATLPADDLFTFAKTCGLRSERVTNFLKVYFEYPTSVGKVLSSMLKSGSFYDDLTSLYFWDTVLNEVVSQHDVKAISWVLTNGRVSEPQFRECIMSCARLGHIDSLDVMSSLCKSDRRNKFMGILKEPIPDTSVLDWINDNFVILTEDLETALHQFYMTTTRNMLAFHKWFMEKKLLTKEIVLEFATAMAKNSSYNASQYDTMTELLKTVNATKEEILRAVSRTGKLFKSVYQQFPHLFEDSLLSYMQTAIVTSDHDLIVSLAKENKFNVCELYSTNMSVKTRFLLMKLYPTFCLFEQQLCTVWSPDTVDIDKSMEAAIQKEFVLVVKWLEDTYKLDITKWSKMAADLPECSSVRQYILQKSGAAAKTVYDKILTGVQNGTITIGKDLDATKFAQLVTMIHTSPEKVDVTDYADILKKFE